LPSIPAELRQRSARFATAAVTGFDAAYQSEGKWPLTRWFQIERVIKAVSGWLPPELIEVNR
jgi:hypothetical protein